MADDLCKHEHLHFGSGGYYIFCRDCGAGWMAKVSTSDLVDYSRSHHALGPDDFRDKPVSMRRLIATGGDGEAD